MNFSPTSALQNEELVWQIGAANSNAAINDSSKHIPNDATGFTLSIQDAGLGIVSTTVTIDGEAQEINLTDANNTSSQTFNTVGNESLSISVVLGTELQQNNNTQTDTGNQNNTQTNNGNKCPEDYGLVLHLEDGTPVSEDTIARPKWDTQVIVANSEDISNLEFMIDEFRNYDVDPNNPNDPDYPKKIVLYNVGTNSGVEDKEHRNPLEVQTLVHTATQWSFNLIYHSGDDPDERNHACPEFYARNITIIAKGSSAVEVMFDIEPYMYQDTVYSNKVDITGTTADSPAQAYVYYDSGLVTINAVGGKEVRSIKLADGFNPAAVTIIDGVSLQFNSGYYASIPLVITLDDGTVGYMDINRLGLALDYVRLTRDMPPDINYPFVFHGSQVGSKMTDAEGYGQVNIVATFYYDKTDSYKDYDIVANLTYADGSEETKVVQGFSETQGDKEGKLKAGDYLVWSGASDDEAPVKVSVTAVKHGAISADTFGGAVFGGGAGVTATDLPSKIRF